VDFKQAFDNVLQQGLWQVLWHYGIPEDLVSILEGLYSKTICAVRVDKQLTEWFNPHPVKAFDSPFSGLGVGADPSNSPS
jgi:hypothetical protein